MWQLLHFRGIPDALVSPLSALYTGTESAIRCERSLSDFVPVDTGVGQGRIEITTLLNISMEHALAKMVDVI